MNSDTKILNNITNWKESTVRMIEFSVVTRNKIAYNNELFLLLDNVVENIYLPFYGEKKWIIERWRKSQIINKIKYNPIQNLNRIFHKFDRLNSKIHLGEKNSWNFFLKN